MERYGPKSNFKWIGEACQDIIFPDSESGSRWKAIDKLSERSCGIPDFRDEMCWAQAVYTCTDLRNRSPESVMKIYMQVPNVDSNATISYQRGFYAKQATREHPSSARYEGHGLCELEARGCTCTPKAITILNLAQDVDMWVPGGFLIVTLMEKLPGRNLSNIWNSKALARAEKDAIRKAFKRSLTEVWECSFEPIDCRRSNLLWDAKALKCYIVDLESCYESKGYKQKWRFQSTYADWGLYDPEIDRRLIEAEEDYTYRIAMGELVE